MILAFTGAGISRASGIPTFQEQDGIREKLERSFATRHPEEYNKVISEMQACCEKAEPNDAHKALAEFDIPILTMNVDGLHEKAGSKYVVNMHGKFPNIVLYGDPAPNYSFAHDAVDRLVDGDIFLIIGVSFYTTISETLRIMARGNGAEVFIINENAEENVRAYLNNHKDKIGSLEEFMSREIAYHGIPRPYQ